MIVLLTIYCFLAYCYSSVYIDLGCFMLNVKAFGFIVFYAPQKKIIVFYISSEKFN